MKNVRFGFHASFSGEREKIFDRVKDLGGECFQFFSRNPYGGKVIPIKKEEAKRFKARAKETNLLNYFIHTPYFINLASKNNKIYWGSIKAIQDDMARAIQLGAKYVVTHIGSAKDFKEEDDNGNFLPAKRKDVLLQIAKERNFSPKAYERIVKGLREITKGYKEAPLILEIAAGAGSIVGVKIKEIAYYLEEVPNISGFCFDTAHAFASGYDVKNVKKVIEKIEKEIGKNKLKLIHANDSLVERDSKHDRHAHIGKGLIGAKPFNDLVDYFMNNEYNIDVILETPTKEGMEDDLKILKGYRDKWKNKV